MKNNIFASQRVFFMYENASDTLIDSKEIHLRKKERNKPHEKEIENHCQNGNNMFRNS